jgi:hypothetical protein
MNSNISLNNILDANKLVGPNILDWYFNASIVLKQEIMLYVLENPIPLAPDEEVKNAYQHHIDDGE